MDSWRQAAPLSLAQAAAAGSVLSSRTSGSLYQHVVAEDVRDRPASVFEPSTTKSPRRDARQHRPEDVRITQVRRVRDRVALDDGLIARAELEEGCTARRTRGSVAQPGASPAGVPTPAHGVGSDSLAVLPGQAEGFHLAIGPLRGKVVARLEVEPEARRGSERAGEQSGRLRRDPELTAHDLVHSLRWHAVVSLCASCQSLPNELACHR